MGLIANGKGNGNRRVRITLLVERYQTDSFLGEHLNTLKALCNN